VKIIDGLRLSTTKIMQKKGGSCLSGCIIGFGLITLILSLIIGKGFQRTFKSLYRDSLYKNYYAQVSETDLELFDSTDKYKNTYQNYGEKNLYSEISILGYANENTYDFDKDYDLQSNSTYQTCLDGYKIDDAEVFITFVDEIFLEDYLYKTSEFDNDFNGKIPILVSVNSITQYFDDPEKLNSSSNKEKFEYIKSQLDKFWGEEYKLKLYKFKQSESKIPVDYYDSYDYSTLDKDDEIANDIEFVIVGFYSSMDVGSVYNYHGEMPIDAYVPKSYLYGSNKLNNFLVKNEDNILSNTTLVFEFDSKKNRTDAINDTSEYKISKMYGNYLFERNSPYQMFSESLNILQKIVLVIGGIMLSVAEVILLITVSKLVKDSTKEIGVFRAVGAQQKDIRNIFFNYASMISLAGLVIAVVLAYLIAITISVLWGENLFYSIAIGGNNFSPNSHPFVLVGFPILELMIIAIISYTLGCIASFFPARKASKMDVVKALKEE